MIINGILNPAINELLCRVRHTNTLIISDRGFPTFPGVHVIDISLIADIPRVTDVLHAVRANFRSEVATMAEEFVGAHPADVEARYHQALEGMIIKRIPHITLKEEALKTVGIIRTGDTTRFGNVMLESA